MGKFFDDAVVSSEKSLIKNFEVGISFKFWGIFGLYGISSASFGGPTQFYSVVGRIGTCVMYKGRLKSKAPFASTCAVVHELERNLQVI